MVLAIGLVVDDAIVVIENVERIMQDEHLPPLEATAKSMNEVTPAVIGIVFSLCSVFCSRRLHGRPGGPDVQTVRHHDRNLGYAFRHCGANAHAGPLR